MSAGSREALNINPYPETEKDVRILYIAGSNLVKSLIVSVVQELKNKRSKEEDLVIFNFHHSVSLCFDMRLNYVKCFSVWAKDYGREKVNVYLHSFHDSCWTEGAEEFIKALYTEIMRIENIDWKDNYDDKPSLEYANFTIKNYDKQFSEEIKDKLYYLDYERYSNGKHEVMEMDYDYTFFPL